MRSIDKNASASEAFAPEQTLGRVPAGRVFRRARARDKGPASRRYPTPRRRDSENSGRGARLDATLGLQQEHGARAKNHGARWPHAGTSRLEAFLQSVTAKFALRYTWIETCPLKTRNVKRAGDRAVAAADAFVGGPADYAGLRILMQGLERTSCCARRIQAMHTLALHEREGRPVVRLVELNDVAGDIV